MPGRLSLALVSAVALFLWASPANAGFDMYVGAAEDAGKSLDLVEAKAKMELARLAGFDAIRLTATWSPGEREVAGRELVTLRNAETAASLTGIRIVLSVYHAGSRTTPLTPAARSDFAQFTASIARKLPGITEYIIGNEPNINRFWMPQFHANGRSASPAAYLALLAATYDAVKSVAPHVEVIGGSVSPRGADKPFLKRPTHSPTRFIRELGRAYRKSGRTLPVMDAFSFHPYGDNSSQPPEFKRNPRSSWISLSGYDKLVSVLGEAFDGTAQAGSDLPIVYDEYGVDSRIPAAKSALYRGREPATTRPVPERTQGSYYRRALALAFCQPNVRGFLLFHVTDEPDLDRWQSGIFYADDTPKTSFGTVRRAVADVRAGRIARCAPPVYGTVVERPAARGAGTSRKKPAKPARTRRATSPSARAA